LFGGGKGLQSSDETLYKVKVGGVCQWYLENLCFIAAILMGGERY